MLIVPLSAIPNQQVQAQLNNQNCTIALQQMAYGLFLTLYVGSALIITNAVCENMNRTVRNAYLGFSGDLAFVDTQGNSDPVYMGLGGGAARFQLYYLTSSDLTALGLRE